MKFKDKMFPYPVIKSIEEDYINSIYSFNVSSFREDDYQIINFEMILTDNTLLHLLESNQVSFLIHLEESRTMFREVFKFNEMNKTIKLPLDKVKNKVEVVSFLISNENICNYKSNNFSTFYESIEFTFEKNLIIGYGKVLDIDIVKEDDDIQSISSIFIVTPSPEIDDIFEIEYSDAVISINVSESLYKTYGELSSTYAMHNSPENKILLTIMVLPAFVEILNMLKEGYSNYENNLWFKSLIQAFKKKEIDIIKEFGVDTFEGYKYAQIVFDDVIRESVERLNHINNERY